LLDVDVFGIFGKAVLSKQLSNQVTLFASTSSFDEMISNTSLIIPETYPSRKNDW
jgi:hypothetical protein